MTRHILCLALAVVLVPVCVVTQAGSPATLEFEVASIKQNRSGSGSFRLHGSPGGRVTAINETPAQLVDWAYALGDFQRLLAGAPSRIMGGPAWMLSERYDVIASAGRAVALEDLRAMVRALLLERFKLAAHYEMKDRPTYALLLARTDRKLGPQLRRTDVDCQAVAAARAEAVRGERPLPPPAPNGAPQCGWGGEGGALRSGGATMDALALKISRDAGRTVVDKTGLSGNYEFTLDYSSSGASGNGVPNDRPTIFTALR